MGGIRNLTKLPQAIFLVGAREAKNAIREARKVGVPVVALVDTNTNPSLIDYPIPSNDDAMRAIEMMVGLMGDAVMEGQKIAAEGALAAAAPVAPTASAHVSVL